MGIIAESKQDDIDRWKSSLHSPSLWIALAAQKSSKRCFVVACRFLRVFRVDRYGVDVWTFFAESIEHRLTNHIEIAVGMIQRNVAFIAQTKWTLCQGIVPSAEMPNSDRVAWG